MPVLRCMDILENNLLPLVLPMKDDKHSTEILEEEKKTDPIMHMVDKITKWVDKKIKTKKI